jgi:catechol 2,3-dioxygenase-like lactoylglutathione lyase family enzyme
MRDFRDAKAIARALRERLKAEKGVSLSVAESLELVARLFDLPNWNVLAARIAEEDPASAGDDVRLEEAVPVIRMFDLAKANEFYCGFLGFAEDWRGEIFPGAPLYMQLSRGNVRLHLSEHHGDAAPGGTTVVRTRGIERLHAELIGKDYKYNRPGLEEASYGALVMSAVDPFGNRLRFEQESAR